MTFLEKLELAVDMPEKALEPALIKRELISLNRDLLQTSEIRLAKLKSSLVPSRNCNAEPHGLQLFEPLVGRAPERLELVRPPVLVELPHALRFERAWWITVVDHERLVSRLEQRDHRISTDAQSRNRAVDRPPAGKGQRTVPAAGGIQYHQWTVEPAARAVDLPFG